MLIAQITDTHIVTQGEHWLAEALTQTAERLVRVVTYLNQMNPSPDLIVLTGDAVDSGAPTDYQHLKELLAPLQAPLYLIPGNHDDRRHLQAAFAQTTYMPQQGPIRYVLPDYPVCLIGLDTLVEGAVHGKIDQEQFAWLIHATRQNASKPTLLFMHHPPIQIGYKLFDAINCRVPAEFEAWLSTQPQILGIIAGHNHHFCISTYGGKPCFIAPSVAPTHYFKHPNDDDATALELEDPAISLHQWHGDGRLTSRFIRLKADDRRLDWAPIKTKAARHRFQRPHNPAS